MTDICVIGSNSFSGSSFVRNLRKDGISVVGVSRSAAPAEVFAPHKWEREGEFAFHQLDINNDLDEIIALIADHAIPYVVNFAAQSMVAESWDAPGDWFQTNTVATVKLHDGLRKMGHLKRYVHVSTPEVYGNCTGSVDEGAAFNPSTPYAVSRAAADMSLRSFHSAYGFPFVITRASNVYGEGQQPYRIIPKTIISILLGKKIPLHGGGESRRNFIHIDDVSSATKMLLERGNVGEDYHICGNQIVSIRELVEMICDIMDVSYDDQVDMSGERLGKDAAYVLNSQKLRRELGWEDRIGLDEGLNKCVAWVEKFKEELRTQPLHYIHRK